MFSLDCPSLDLCQKLVKNGGSSESSLEMRCLNNYQALPLLISDQISKLNSQGLHSETKGAALTLTLIAPITHPPETLQS